MTGDRMVSVLAALREQDNALLEILRGLDEDGWSLQVPRCPGWTVSDVVLHLAQTDELAAASAAGQYREAPPGFASPGTVDDAAADAVARERGRSSAHVLARWHAATVAQYNALAAADPTARLSWVTNTLSPATLATTRLAETWTHTGDIQHGLGLPATIGSGLPHIAWLAWQTLPYAFARAGKSLAGPVAAVLTAPGNTELRFGDLAAATTTVRGPAEDWCLVASQRLAASATQLRAEGPDGEAVLALVRTYA